MSHFWRLLQKIPEQRQPVNNGHYFRALRVVVIHWSISSTLNGRILRTKAFFLVTFWLWTNFRTKVKRWWNRHLVWEYFSALHFLYTKPNLLQVLNEKLILYLNCLRQAKSQLGGSPATSSNGNDRDLLLLTSPSHVSVSLIKKIT